MSGSNPSSTDSILHPEVEAKDRIADGDEAVLAYRKSCKGSPQLLKGGEEADVTGLERGAGA